MCALCSVWLWIDIHIQALALDAARESMVLLKNDGESKRSCVPYLSPVSPVASQSGRGSHSQLHIDTFLQLTILSHLIHILYPPTPLNSSLPTPLNSSPLTPPNSSLPQPLIVPLPSRTLSTLHTKSTWQRMTSSCTLPHTYIHN